MEASHRVSGRPPGDSNQFQHEIDAILRRHRLSGFSLLAFAFEHDPSYATLLRWRRQALDPGHLQTPKPICSPTFIPVELEPATAGAELVLDWAPNRSLRIFLGFNPAEARRLLDVLGMPS